MRLLVPLVLLLLFTPRQGTAQSYVTKHQEILLSDYATGLRQPWGATFLPDGRLLITEKSGRLRIIDKSGLVSPPVPGIPTVDSSGQGGLLDVEIAPDFSSTNLVYLSYAEADEDGRSGTAVGRGKLVNNKLQDFHVLWRQTPKVNSSAHFGSRLVFRQDGSLFITTGDRYAYRDQAQSRESQLGKVIRISNPTVREKLPIIGSIWSYGHRNIQGAALHPVTRELWTHEHGAQGGDEVNITREGKNYGWPIITHGVDYSGAKIGIGSAMDGMEQPVHYWTPSIAPSGMLFYTGNVFPRWKGNLFIGALKSMHLNRLALEGEKVVEEERLLSHLNERIRSVEQDAAGNLYILTDNSNGRVLKISSTAHP